MNTNKNFTLVITQIYVSDSKKTRSWNKTQHDLYYGARNGVYPWSKEYEGCTLCDLGAEDLDKVLGEEGVNELLAAEVESEFYKKRFNFEGVATLQDMFDAMPVYSEICVDFLESRGTYVIKRGVRVIKESEETDSELASGRVLSTDADYALGKIEEQRRRAFERKLAERR